jgi:hypothetical protein
MSKLYDFLNAIVSKLNVCVKTEAQTFTEAQKAQARKNIGAAEEGGTGGSPDAVLYTEQTLTEEQKKQARKNIGAVPAVTVGSDTLTWDGSGEGVLVCPELEASVYKLSDNVLTAADVASGMVVSGVYNGAEYRVNVTADEIVFNDDGYASVDINVANGVYRSFDIVPCDNYSNPFFAEAGFDLRYPTSGIWAFDNDVTVTLTIPGYTGFAKEVIDTKYLPEHLQFGEKEVVFLDEEAVPFESGLGGATMSSFAPVGSMVTVVLDGVTYTCKVFALDVDVAFGNPMLGGLEEDTGEPFFGMFAADFGELSLLHIDADATSHAIKITGTDVVKLPIRYCDATVCFYTGSGYKYLYLDAYRTTKATKNDVEQLVGRIPIAVNYGNTYYQAVFVDLDFEKEYAAVTVCRESGFAVYYTAEYTPPTT